MGKEDYLFWTNISEPQIKKVTSNSEIKNPIQHLKENYKNTKHPIAFSGISNIYRYYDGKLTQKQIKNYLSTENAYTLHKKSRVTGYNPTFIKYKRQQIQLDLVDIQNLSKSNDDYRYLLMGIDCFTRYGFCEPLKDKKSQTVLSGFKALLQKAKKYPSSVVSDSGSEFTNNKFVQFCKENSIKCHQSYTSIHASFVERFNRTIKNRIYSYMDSHNTQRFVDVLQDIITAYNNTNHRMIGTTPSKAELKQNHSNVRENLQKYYSKFSKQKPKYKVGDTVRITVLGNKFHRGFEVQNKDEVFVISDVNTNLPRPLYKLHTFGDPNEIIKGSFYGNELTLTNLDQFYIEKVLRKTKNKVLVKWQGYQVPTWEPRKYIESILNQNS